MKTVEGFDFQFDQKFGYGSLKNPIIQSDRLEMYQKAADTLLEKGNAYYCACTPKKDQFSNNYHEEFDSETCDCLNKQEDIKSRSNELCIKFKVILFKKT